MSATSERFDLWCSGGYELAEGARWVDNRLVFVDILSGRLFEASGADPSQPRLIAQVDVPLSAVAPVAGAAGTWIVAAGTGIALLDGTGTLTWLDRPEDGSGPAMRMNDGACDAFGRFWAGSMAFDGTPGAGSLYRVDADATVSKVLDGMTIVNGPAFSSDGRIMYVTDTAVGRVYRCTLEAASGDIVDRHLFAEIGAEHGSPDGMTVDVDGNVWIAMWGGSSVRCYTADGALVRIIPVPAQQPTSVCLAGGRLFVTTARYGLRNPAAESGAVLCSATDADAPPAQPFARSTASHT